MPNPYSYSFNTPSETYEFNTKNKILYRVAFVEDHTLNTISPLDFDFKNIHQIVVEKITDGVEPFDRQVSLTITQIITDFFSNLENALIYVCSNDQGKEVQRYNFFNRWYNTSSQKEVIIKLDHIVHLEDDNVIHISLLCHKENPSIDNILDAFKRIEQVLNTEK